MPKKAVKRAALLDEAARQINDRGAGAISLVEIGEAVGLSRNALYYYVSDRADLVFRCYLARCEADAEDLAIAYEAGNDAVERIRVWIARSMALAGQAHVVISDRDFLPPQQRAAVHDLQIGNAGTLQAIIEDGIRNGLFRSVDAAVAANVLIGMVNWSQLAGRWLGHNDAKANRRRAAAAIEDIALNGITADRTRTLTCGIDATALVARDASAFDREAESRRKSEALQAAASYLFNRRGIDGTSLDDVAAHVGATKGTVYHYFDDKAELTIACYYRAFDLYEQFMKAAGRLGTGLERSVAIAHLNSQAQAGAIAPLILQPGLLTFPAEAQHAFANRANALWRRSVQSLRRGIRDGSCRPCDAVAVTEASAGAFLWLPKWVGEGRAGQPRAVADDVIDVVGRGLLRSN